MTDKYPSKLNLTFHLEEDGTLGKLVSPYECLSEGDVTLFASRAKEVTISGEVKYRRSGEEAKCQNRVPFVYLQYEKIE